MMSFRRSLLPLVLVLALFGPTTVSAGGKNAVHVKAYTKKDGTTVAAHERKAPERHASASRTETPRTSTLRQPAVAVARDERGRIQRSDAARHAFAQQTGYRNGRPGFVIDHIVPLACGGDDKPSNMQWQTVAQAKAKDKTERAGCR